MEWQSVFPCSQKFPECSLFPARFRRENPPFLSISPIERASKETIDLSAKVRFVPKSQPCAWSKYECCNFFGTTANFNGLRSELPSYDFFLFLPENIPWIAISLLIIKHGVYETHFSFSCFSIFRIDVQLIVRDFDVHFLCCQHEAHFKNSCNFSPLLENDLTGKLAFPCKIISCFVLKARFRKLGLAWKVQKCCCKQSPGLFPAKIEAKLTQ